MTRRYCATAVLVMLAGATAAGFGAAAAGAGATAAASGVAAAAAVATAAGAGAGAAEASAAAAAPSAAAADASAAAADATTVGAGAADSEAPVRWGFHGHEISGRAAATRLPGELPAFFRDATEQLAYLNPEPDRWRGDQFRELGEAYRYDHYIDFEVIPAGLLDQPDRWGYLFALRDAGIASPPRDAGLLPYHIMELYQRLVVEWRLWRRETDTARRRWIEQRILNDAGTLGHYVTDGANPHHTTVHHDRWAEGYPNPRGFTTERGFHSRFESAFVQANIQTRDLLPHINGRPRLLDDVRAEVLAYLMRSHSRLERLYELDQQEAFGPATRGAAHKAFAVERLVAGSNMLRDLWWTAWARSE